MKYVNVLEVPMKFRAHNIDGIKQVFQLKPGEQVESDRKLSFSGLELVKEIKLKTKTTKKTNHRGD